MKRMLNALCALALGLGCQTTTTTGGAGGGAPNPGAGGADTGGAADGRGGDAEPARDEVPPPPLEAGEVLRPAAGDFALRDAETGTLWNLRGEAFEGPLAEEGARLRQLPGYVSFWFAWSVFNHDTDIWTVDGVNGQDVPPIEGGGGCAVPCQEIVSGGPPKDGIPSVDHDGFLGDLTMVAADDPAARYLNEDDLVLGVVVERGDGSREARAYSHNLLWWHEIVNDQVEGRPFTVSFCPLTGSGLVFPGGDDALSFGTSGRLFNSNLVMYDRVTDSQWSQMMRAAVTGDRIGERLSIAPVVQTTWARWKTLWPETTVTSLDTGFNRDYSRYPYVFGGQDYRENHENTFRPTRPDFDRSYGAKVRTLGVELGDGVRGYPFEELAAMGTRVALNDEVGGRALVVVFETSTELAVPFSRRVGDQVLTFEVAEAP